MRSGNNHITFVLSFLLFRDRYIIVSFDCFKVKAKIISDISHYREEIIEKKNVTFDKINPINMELFRVLQSLESHTIYYWIVIAIIGFAISQSLLVGIRFYFKKENEPRSYLFFALLLLAFGFTQLHFV